MTTSLGHKRSQHLIEAEAYRQIMSGEAPEILVKFAQQLLDWLRQIISRCLAEHVDQGRETRSVKLGIVVTT